jgi:hypothetical protein
MTRINDSSLEIERLRREHRELDDRLMTLCKRPFLNPDEELEKKTLQKLKLLRRRTACFSSARPDGADPPG